MRRRTLGVKKRTDYHDYPHDRYRIFLIGILHGGHVVHRIQSNKFRSICHLHRHLQQNLLSYYDYAHHNAHCYIITIRKSLPTAWPKRYNLS